MSIPSVDPKLIYCLRQGDETAFEKLFQFFHIQLFQFAYTFCKDRELAQEITQEAFVQLWINREKLNPDLPLYPYLFTQVRRMTIDAFRKKLLQMRYMDEHLKFVDIEVEETAQTVQRRELTRLIEAAVRQLPKHQQRVFEMSRVEGLSYEEIAEQLHISKNTVKYHLVKALQNLRKALAHYELSCVILMFILHISIFF